ncbi:MAG TPA: ABC transporter substrate-binding protein [Gemmatimonadaceae bacterium]|nr:ABC transporter substrate-binding protein [Gemmatimonadaceae bacterium]
MRVVSLLASGTEIVCALGASDMLVGRSHECDNPDWVRSLPSCSSPAFDVSGSSREIDAEVRRRMHAGEPLYIIHTDLITALRPDVVIAQTHCEVCAVTPNDVQRDGACLDPRQMVALSAFSLDDISGSILAVAERLGLAERGRAVVAAERARLDAVRAATAHRPRPDVALLEWTDPLFVMGNWMPEVVMAAGGTPLLAHPGDYSSATTFECVRDADPDVVIVAPCGFPLARALAERHVLESYPGWRDLRAVRDGSVVIADGNRFFNRSGMTVSRTAEMVAEMLHGVCIGESSHGSWWRWLDRDAS